jgi:hypothetical protein
MSLSDYSALPPTVFLLMTRDAITLKHVEKNAAILKDTLIIRAEPKPIGPHFFFEHGGALSKEDSAAVQAALKKNLVIDQENLLMEDPRLTEWREVHYVALSIHAA